MEQCNHPATCLKRGCGRRHLTVFHDYYNRGSENKPSLPPQQPYSSEKRGSENKPSPHHQHQQTNQARGSENKTSQPQTNNKSENKPNNQTSATARMCAENNNQPANLTSWTIPVYISSPDNPNNEILVYALLDSGSNRTFITEKTVQKLKVKTQSIPMNISTLTDVNGSYSDRPAAFGLIVRGYNQQKRIALPPCVSQSEIPSNPDEIPNSTSVLDWPHLRHIATELIPVNKSRSLELGLLIGGNLPQVFMSRQEITRGDHEPFARLTDLGWTVMGNTTKHESSTISNLAESQPSFSDSSPSLQYLPKSERNMQYTQSLEPDIDCQETKQTLKIPWPVKADSFQFSFSVKTNPIPSTFLSKVIFLVLVLSVITLPFVVSTPAQYMCGKATSTKYPLAACPLLRWEGVRSSLPDAPNIISITSLHRPPDISKYLKPKTEKSPDLSASHHMIDVWDETIHTVPNIRRNPLRTNGGRLDTGPLQTQMYQEMVTISYHPRSNVTEEQVFLTSNLPISTIADTLLPIGQEQLTIQSESNINLNISPKNKCSTMGNQTF